MLDRESGHVHVTLVRWEDGVVGWRTRRSGCKCKFNLFLNRRRVVDVLSSQPYPDVRIGQAAPSRLQVLPTDHIQADRELLWRLESSHIYQLRAHPRVTLAHPNDSFERSHLPNRAFLGVRMINPAKQGVSFERGRVEVLLNLAAVLLHPPIATSSELRRDPAARELYT